MKSKCYWFLLFIVLQVVILQCQPVEEIAEGALDISLFWNPELFICAGCYEGGAYISPRIEAQAISIQGEGIELPLAIFDEGSGGGRVPLSPGKYTITVQVLRGETVLRSAIEVVEIFRDEKSMVTIDFSRQPGEPVLKNNALNPLLRGHKPQIRLGETILLRASLPGEELNIVYSWYSKDESRIVRVGSDFTFVAEKAGWHSFMVVAARADGMLDGMLKFNIQVMPAPLTGINRTVNIIFPSSVAPGETFFVSTNASTDARDSECVGFFHVDYSLNGGATWRAVCYDVTKEKYVERVFSITAKTCSSVIKVRMRVAFRGGKAGDVYYDGTPVNWEEDWTNWFSPLTKYSDIIVSGSSSD